MHWNTQACDSQSSVSQSFSSYCRRTHQLTVALTQVQAKRERPRTAAAAAGCCGDRGKPKVKEAVKRAAPRGIGCVQGLCHHTLALNRRTVCCTQTVGYSRLQRALRSATCNSKTGGNVTPSYTGTAEGSHSVWLHWSCEGLGNIVKA